MKHSYVTSISLMKMQCLPESTLQHISNSNNYNVAESIKCY